MLSASFVVSILLQLVLPLALAFYVVRHYHTEWRLVSVGVLAYLAYQVLQAPLFEALSGTEFYASLTQSLPQLTAAVLVGFVSAVVEQALVIGGFWFVRKSIADWKNGLTVTAGHAAVESALIGVQFLINFVFAISITSTGVQALPNITPEEATALQQQITSFWALPWYLPLSAGLQRVALLLMQFALGIMIWLAVSRKAWVWVATAILWETAINGVVIAISVNMPDLLNTGLYIVIGAVNAGIVYLLYRKSQPGESNTTNMLQSAKVVQDMR
jgi:uncharacterized membrane protein YhfC